MSRYDEMLTYIPDYYLTSAVVLALLSAEGPEIDSVRAAFQDVLNQFYATTATDAGLTLWENELGLSTLGTRTIEERRSRVISKLRGVGTVTNDLLKSVAESYENGSIDIIENAAGYSVTVKFVDQRGIPSNINDLEAAIQEIIPAHIALTFQFIYTTWGEVKTLTWAEVATGTWADLKTKEV